MENEVYDLLQIRADLPHGGIKEIAEELNISSSVVSQVFTGKFKSYRKDVVEKALDIIESEDNDMEELNDRLEKHGYIITEQEFEDKYPDDEEEEEEQEDD